MPKSIPGLLMACTSNQLLLFSAEAWCFSSSSATREEEVVERRFDDHIILMYTINYVVAQALDQVL